MPRLHLLRVFCADGRLRRQPAGRVPRRRRGAARAASGRRRRPRPERDRVRRRRRRGEIRIFTPAEELDFAGHPSVGTAWLLDGGRCLRPPAGEVAVRRDGDDVYVTARPEWGPPWRARAAGLARRGRGARRSARWSRPGGRVGMDRRGRRDAPRAGVPGRARHRRGRGDRLGRDKAVRPGGPAGRDPPGPRIAHPRAPAGDGFVEIGGRCALDDVRDYTLP